MGLYVNPDNSKFNEDINSEIYVDKTMLLAELNKRIGTRDKYLCVSRPRRFGKTMAERMMAAYYSRGCDSAVLFQGFQIASDESFARHLNKYNVLHLDINRFWSQYGRDAIPKMHDFVRDDFAETFPDLEFRDDFEIPNLISEVFKKTKIPFVVVFDEYDVLFRDDNVPKCVVEEYLKFLNVLFKSDDMSSCITLAYLTGILPIIREKAQSKLNNFEEITFLRPGKFAEFEGFAASEVKMLCEKFGMDFEECRSWYDGYRLGGLEIYSPRSVVMAMRNGEYDGYWSETSTFKVVRDFVSGDFDMMGHDVSAMLSGGSVAVDIRKFDNTPFGISTKDEAITYLAHLGYLAYDKDEQSCRIPNREVRAEWMSAIEDVPEHSRIVGLIRNSKSLLESVWGCDGCSVAAALEKTHECLTSPLTYNNEGSFQSAIRLAFFYADCFYTIVSEYPSGKGYADLAFIPYKPDIPAMLVELKVKGTAGTALDQIRDRRYFAGLEKYEGSLLLVGISYDPKTKKHECLIEKA